MSTHATSVTAYRDLIVSRAIEARKIAPDRADDYKRLFDADPPNITRLLTAPLAEGGLMAGVAAIDNPWPAVPTDYPADWLPEVNGPQLPRVMGEDVSHSSRITIED